MSLHQPHRTSSAIAPILPQGQGRIVPVDAARGLMMIFSCIAHFAWWISPVFPDLAALLGALGMIATPGFLLISGAMVGLLCSSPSRAKTDLKSQLFNRGLFLLTVGHLLVSLAEAHRSGGALKTLRGLSVIDVIAICTLLAAFAYPWLQDKQRSQTIALCGGLVFIVSWSLVLIWHPTTIVPSMLKYVLFGGDPDHPHYVVPLLQYLSIYAMGLPLGHHLSAMRAGAAQQALLARPLIKCGMGLIIGACALRALRHVIDNAHLVINTNSINNTLSITKKIPPSPTYLMFFAGAAIASLGLLFRFWQSSHPAGQRIVRWLIPLGQASLFIFILQYFLFWTLPDLIGIKPNVYAGLLFTADLVVIHYAAVIWTRARGNRLMTFGLKLTRT